MPRKKEIKNYEHVDKKRLNNPQVGLVNEQTEPYTTPTKSYQYDPHLDPQLIWSGKAENTSFEIPTVSLHVHERIDPRTIINNVQKTNDSDKQISLFEVEKKPLRSALEFYQHKEGWTNRLIAGDSLLVMNSLLEKEGLAGKVQMVYVDPPYGIKYGSNFQPFVNRRDVKDRKDEDLTAEPEMIKAFRDTWELGIHSYLTYLRNRLLLARELLHESGSIFVQISDENVHHVRELMDEIFGAKNFVNLITVQKTSGKTSQVLNTISDYVIFYSKKKEAIKYHQLWDDKLDSDTLKRYNYLELPDGKSIKLTKDQIEGREAIPEGKRWGDYALHSQGETNSETGKPFEFCGEVYYPKKGRHWSNPPSKLKIAAEKGRIVKLGNDIRYKRYADDFPVKPINNIWLGTAIGKEPIFVVQTGEKII
jgi:adenine-specific DNA-methyltransferase